MENKAKEFSISPQTVRNYVKEQPQVIEQMLNVTKTIKQLSERRRVKIVIDRTSITRENQKKD
ncbi:hypothetical protein [Sulfolobus sp. S-194]|uniref:hypothetical protein n=1 Tax=Sulfolobus sp. S-194 TaxID=2512240 RepID=UPI002570968B|nr:hypothetical protein [Sulfolobus sp. S-194]